MDPMLIFWLAPSVFAALLATVVYWVWRRFFYVEPPEPTEAEIIEQMIRPYKDGLDYRHHAKEDKSWAEREVILPAGQAQRFTRVGVPMWAIALVAFILFLVITALVFSRLPVHLYLASGMPPVLKAFVLWVFYFGTMLFGMAGQYFWGLKTMKRFRWSEFLRPMWVSFIVFTPFWAAANVDEISYTAAAAAYQNGFFWKVILDTEEKTLKNKPKSLIGGGTKAKRPRSIKDSPVGKKQEE